MSALPFNASQPRFSKFAGLLPVMLPELLMTSVVTCCLRFLLVTGTYPFEDTPTDDVSSIKKVACRLASASGFTL